MRTKQHFGRTPDQISHQHAARVDRGNYASVNHGTPAHPEGMGVNARQDRQQNRINQGVHSGQMTPGETTHVENNETDIHDEAQNRSSAEWRPPDWCGAQPDRAPAEQREPPD